MIGSIATILVLMAATDKSGSVISLSNAAEPRNIYLVAHQDDWQLFMGDIVVEDLRGGGQSAFIYLTAGDDGRDSLYWRAREQAALASTRIAAGNPFSSSEQSMCAPIVVRQHTIRRCVQDRTESYFLRLPDGKRNGTGYPRYDNQSMRRLRAQRIATMTAVDGSATYHGWEDLVSSVNELLGATRDRTVTIHTTDPSVVSNPHDHFDHRMAGLLVNDLRKRLGLSVRYYIGYALATRAANRTNVQAREKTETFLAYDQEMMRVNKNWSAYREHPSFYSECMVRTYARTPLVR